MFDAVARQRSEAELLNDANQTTETAAHIVGQSLNFGDNGNIEDLHRPLHRNSIIAKKR